MCDVRFCILLDPCEHTDLSAKEPEVLQHMLERLKLYLVDTAPPDRLRAAIPNYTDCAPGGRYGDVWHPCDGDPPAAWG